MKYTKHVFKCMISTTLVSLLGYRYQRVIQVGTIKVLRLVPKMCYTGTTSAILSVTLKIDRRTQDEVKEFVEKQVDDFKEKIKECVDKETNRFLAATKEKYDAIDIIRIRFWPIGAIIVAIIVGLVVTVACLVEYIILH